MASNPMQRQARNSFLLGMVVTIILAGVVVGFLFMQLKNVNEELTKERQSVSTVYVLNQDVKSGQVITADLFKTAEVKKAGIPANATGDIYSMLSAYSLADKAGNNIYTDKDGKLYMQDGETKIEVYQEELTGNYYTQETNGEKKYIETTEKPLIAKVDMRANTVITGAFIARSDEINTDDTRVQEYNMIALPIDLVTNDFIDIRLMLPTGQDYIVIAKKRVTVPVLDGAYLADTIQLQMREDEVLSLSSAIVEAYKIDGAKLYATKYIEAGMQEMATPTYVVNNEVASLIESNPNIVSDAMSALKTRYNSNNGRLRDLRNNYINSALEQYGNDSNVSSGIDESITSSQETRQQYLQTLVPETY